MSDYIITTTNGELYHHGVLGMKWGVRRYQNPDGSLKPLGYRQYNVSKAYHDAKKYNSEYERQNNRSHTYNARVEADATRKANAAYAKSLEAEKRFTREDKKQAKFDRKLAKLHNKVYKTKIEVDRDGKAKKTIEYDNKYFQKRAIKRGALVIAGLTLATAGGIYAYKKAHGATFDRGKALSEMELRRMGVDVGHIYRAHIDRAKVDKVPFNLDMGNNYVKKLKKNNPFSL